MQQQCHHLGRWCAPKWQTKEDVSRVGWRRGYRHRRQPAARQSPVALQPGSANGTFGRRSSPPARPSTHEVAIEIEPAPMNSRKIRAAVCIAAPITAVWRALTAYEALGTFIPGLTVNRCLERWHGGAKLLQVGQQDVMMGLKFEARCVLRVEEHAYGIPDSWRSNEVIVSPGGWRGPASSSSGSSSNGKSGGSRGATGPPSSQFSSGGSGYSSSSGSEEGGAGSDSCRDISFQLLEGDFQVFKGIWRMQQGDHGPSTTLLSYSLFVRPQVWLPVGLVQSRIEREIVNNLTAVRDHVEGRKQQRRPATQRS